MRASWIDTERWGNDIEKRFRDFIRGKSVAIVSSAPMLEDLTMGEEIDGHDIVVRIHSPMRTYNWKPDDEFMPLALRDKIGIRCDIFYTSGWDMAPDKFRRMIQSFVDQGGEFLCAENAHLEDSGMQRLYDIQDIVMARAITLHDKGIFSQHLGSIPFPGTTAIMDIARYQPKELLLVGFQCLVTNSKPAGITIKNGNSVSKRDFNFLRELWRDNDNVSVDPIVESLFGSVSEDLGDPICVDGMTEDDIRTLTDWRS